MKKPSPWELPLEVVHHETKHVVGQVHRDGDFIAFLRSGAPYYDLRPEGAIMRTIPGLNVRLTSDEPNPQKLIWGNRLDKAIYDECLLGEAQWSLGDEPLFDTMRLPCDNIAEYMSVMPLAHSHEADGGILLRASNFNRFEFHLPEISAKGHVRFTFGWSAIGFGEQRFTPQAALVLNYSTPTPLSIIKEHEERLRSFFDFFWFRGHRVEELYLHAGDKLSLLFRRSSTSPGVRAATCLDLDGILNEQYLPAWIERWFNVTQAVQMALSPVIAIARNPGIITDMKLVMSIHALDAMLKATRRPKGKANEARFFHGLRDWWQMKRDLSGESLYDYIKRLISTRNVVLKVSQDAKQADKPLLATTDRTKAYYECLLLHRALFLELMGVEPTRISTYLNTGFGQIAQTHFRYFKD